MEKYTILIADDDTFSLNITASNLRKYNRNYEILKTQDGRKACKMADHHLPDLIILDWEMPVMTGIEALKHLKKNPKTSDIPVVMATALVSSEYLEKALDAGAIDYLRKPVDFLELRARVKSALALSKSYQKIKRQKEIIEKSNFKITESLNYASRIQKAILPEKNQIERHLENIFILYRPRDIVSGDFYWFTKIPAKRGLSEKLILAVVDCTGHGVPGALMSIIGELYLNQIILTKKILRPDLILRELHKNIRKALRQDENMNDDGMDIAICSIDKENKKIQFAGAEIPLIYFKNNEMKRIRGEEFSVGGVQEFGKRIFKLHEIELDTQTMFYMFSDGFQDQFGGENSEKFFPRRFYDLLDTIHQKEIEEQRNILNTTLNKWMETENRQTDDILVVGVRL